MSFWQSNAIDTDEEDDSFGLNSSDGSLSPPQERDLDMFQGLQGLQGLSADNNGQHDIQQLNKDLDRLYAFNEPSDGSLVPLRSRKTEQRTRNRKRQQGRLLLTALLETFCQMYAQSPEDQQLFNLICESLARVGIIEEEHLKELATVRSTYTRAFQTLMQRALQTIRTKRPSFSSSQSFSLTSSAQILMQDASPIPLRRLASSPQFTDDFSKSKDIFEHRGRYHYEFEELEQLGRGGYASVKKCLNKLDGQVYAVKMIKLGEADAKRNKYEKVFRECKNLARIKHPNIVGYYGSWIEHVPMRGRDNATHLYLDNKPHKSIQSDYSFDDTGGVVFAEDSGGIDFTEDSIRSINSTNGDESKRTGGSINGGEPHRRSSNEGDSVSNTRGSTSNSKKAATAIKIPKKTLTSTSRSSYKTQMSSLSEQSPTSSLSSSIETIPRDSSFASSIARSMKRSSLGMTPSDLELTLFIQMQLCESSLDKWIYKRNEIGTRHAREHLAMLDHESCCPLTASQHCDNCAKRIKAVLDRRHDIQKECGACIPTRSRCLANKYHYVDRDLASDIFRAICAAVRHLHERHGLIHRDIKPANIFLTLEDIEDEEGQMIGKKWVPRLGDFGLVTLIEDALKEDHNVKRDSRQYDPSKYRTSNVGTHIYGAPEQLQTDPASSVLEGDLRLYDEKVDIYSLGITFFELLCPFETGMERADTLRALREASSGLSSDGEPLQDRPPFPPGFVEAFPKESSLILWMLQPDPALRPSAKHVLSAHKVFAAEGENKVKVSIDSALHEENLRLRQEMQKVDKELEAVRRELATLKGARHI